MGLPRRIDVVFRFWPCDKKNHGWREGPPLTVPCQSFDLLPGLRPPVKSVSNETRILLYVAGREPQHNFGRFKTTIRPSDCWSRGRLNEAAGAADASRVADPQHYQ